MKYLRKVNVLSLAYLQAVFGAIIGLIFGLFVTLASLTVGSVAQSLGGEDGMMGGAAVFGVGAVIVMPILYGIGGFIGGAISALLYNLAAKLTGGIALHLEDKNDAASTPSQAPAAQPEQASDSR